MKNETIFARKAVKWLNSKPDTFFFKNHGSPFSRAGVSDLIGCINGRYVAIELKVGSNKLTEIQNRFLSWVLASGGVGAVCWSMDDIEAVYNKVKETVA